MSFLENHEPKIGLELFLQIKTAMKRESEDIQLLLEEIETQVLEESIRRMWLRNQLPIYNWNVHNLPEWLLDELKTLYNLRQEIDIKFDKLKTMQNILLEKHDKFFEFMTTFVSNSKKNAES